MSLPPIPLPKAVNDALGEALKPAARKVGAGLVTLIESMLRGQSKSPAEQILDKVDGEIAASRREASAIAQLSDMQQDPDFEYQRILAKAAASHVPVDRFVMPALQIAGPIFTQSEFAEHGSPVWEMWAQLLARACDKDRVDQAHPAFPWIISQLSNDEARLLAALSPLQPRNDRDQQAPVLNTDNIGMLFANNLGFYLGHFDMLGLIVKPFGWNPIEHTVVIGGVQTYMLNDFGRRFMQAVTSRSP